MPDATAAFFAELERRSHEPLLGRATGTICFELTDEDRIDRWTVAVDRGDVSVAQDGGDGEPECVVRAPKALFDDLARGKANATAAALRGAIAVEGDMELLILLQRLFPGPPASTSEGDGDER
jgi:putative sterol carrier protein